MRTRKLALLAVGGCWLASLGGCPFPGPQPQDAGEDFSAFVKSVLTNPAESDPVEIDETVFDLDDATDNYDDVIAGDLAPAAVAAAEVE